MDRTPQFITSHSETSRPDLFDMLQLQVFYVLLVSTVGLTSSTINLFKRLVTPSIKTSVLKSNIDLLQEQRYLIWPNFLDSEDILELHDDIESRYQRGEMKDAGVKGRNVNSYIGQQGSSVMTDIRKTSICWLDYLDPKTDIENSLLMFFDAFRLQLCDALTCELNFEDTEVLYARYPEMGFYSRHSDSHVPAVGISDRDTERYISIVLYVNDHPWQENDGGSLRMFGDEYEPWTSSIDVPPVPGTLLLFFSQGLSHEVLVTSVIRYAVVCWFRIRAVQRNQPLFASTPLKSCD